MKSPCQQVCNSRKVSTQQADQDVDFSRGGNEENEKLFPRAGLGGEESWKNGQGNLGELDNLPL